MLQRITKRDTNCGMSYDVNSIGELVWAFGGDTEVARWLGITQPAVANWKVRSQIPPGWHLRLWARAKREGRSVNPAIFGFDVDDPEVDAVSIRGRPRRGLRAVAV